MGIKLKYENVQELRNTKCYMIGRLANSNEFAEPIFGDAAERKFRVVPLCKEKKTIEDINYLLPSNENTPLYAHRESSYIGFVENNLKSYLPLDFNSDTFTYSEKEKVKIVNNLLDNKLIIFKTRISVSEEFDKRRQSGGYRDYKIFKNIDIEKIVDISDVSIKEKEQFIRVPKLSIEEKEFLYILNNNGCIELEEYPYDLEPPEYIICGNHIYIFDITYWDAIETTSHIPSYNSSIWTYTGDLNKVIALDIENENIGISCSEYTYFMTKEMIENYLNKISDISEMLKSTDKIKNEYEGQYEFDGQSIYRQYQSQFSFDDIRQMPSNYYKKEIDFLKGVDLYCKKNGLAYKYEDIVNMHISIKTNFITILSGMTGTGKSQLAHAYAKMLDVSLENENLLFVPISPSYMEPSDLLGYYNSNLGMYTPSETNLVDFLVRASKNTDKEFIIIFDEMNLSQVEHWFAPFLSLLEANEENRFLSLYSKNTRCINDEKYPNSIKIGNNVRIIGTINLDETIKEFSDRLLDRTNIINLERLKFSQLKVSLNCDFEHKSYEEYICGDSEEIKSWIVDCNTIDILSDKLDFFDELHELISKYDYKKGISFRVLNAIASYVANIPVDENGKKVISDSYAIDLQVKQRIISKLKGTNRTVGKLIGDIIDFLEQNKFEQISDFKKTKELLDYKVRELNLYGYTY